jgi:multicomponent Na+:H+ antiporter subunit E
MIKKHKGMIVLFLILMFFWIVWNNSLDVRIWGYGLIIALPVTLMFRRGVYIFDGVKLTPSGIWYSLVYVAVFLAAVVRSNIDVIRRVLHPGLPVRPGIVRIETRLTSPLARMILANSITLTPGTFVVDIRDKYIYVHWIELCCDGDPAQATQIIAGKFENLLLKIYE